MKKWQIKDVKACMGSLLLSSAFDELWLEQAQITMKNTISMDGHFQKEFFSREEIEENGLEHMKFVRWKELRPLCYELIKGKKTPYHMKIEFQLPEENYEELIKMSGTREFRPGDIQGCHMRFLYQDQKLSMVSGISLKLFSLDKTLEEEWDKKAESYLKQNRIAYD